MRISNVRRWISLLLSCITVFAALMIYSPVRAEAQGLPKITLGIEETEEPREIAMTLQILALMTVLSLAPSILIMMTSFTRIIVVFHFLRQALGTQQMPPNQLLIGLALFLTFFVMAPVLSQVNDVALKPFLDKEIDHNEALDLGMKPVRDFMMAQTREKDLGLFMKISDFPKPSTKGEIPMKALIPGFIISELRKAFQIGFILYIPLLIIDLVVASVLMSMGMMMLPPVMISLPFKILLFVLVDGWNLVIGSLISGIKF